MLKSPTFLVFFCASLKPKNILSSKSFSKFFTTSVSNFSGSGLYLFKTISSSLILLNAFSSSSNCFLLNFSCSQEKNYNAQIKGNTMGTYYFIEVIDVPIELKIKNIEIEIKNTLKKANKILSNWDKNSEISIINKSLFIKIL